MIRLTLLLALLGLPGLSLAEMTAARLLVELELVDTQDLAPEEGMRFLLASGFVQGAVEMGNGSSFCLPPNFTNAQLMGVMRGFLRQTPERGHEPAVMLIREAFTSAFPCTPEKR